MKRREFLWYSIQTLLAVITSVLSATGGAEQGKKMSQHLGLFLCGDVMTGRGIDQILPHPCKPHLYESYVKDARRYVKLAEAVNGRIARPVASSYIWGDALEVLEAEALDVRIINLETSVTKSEDYWRDKGIHYRMHPENIPCLTSAGIDCCVLANNHVMDWGYAGLEDTMETLRDVNIQTAGAGHNRDQAKAPALLEVPEKGRVIVMSMGIASSGIGWDWSATEQRPGVNLLADLSAAEVRKIADQLQAIRRAGDIVVASIHWGGNWGYEVSAEEIRFAHQLIDEAGVDIVHGHSSHHAKGIEVYNGKPILYGCGDFINDYEGIPGYEGYRDDLSLMYLVRMAPATGKLVELKMIPMQIRQFRLHHASERDAAWLKDTLHRESRRFDTGVEIAANGSLQLHW